MSLHQGALTAAAPDENDSKPAPCGDPARRASSPPATRADEQPWHESGTTMKARTERHPTPTRTPQPRRDLDVPATPRPERSSNRTRASSTDDLAGPLSAQRASA